MGLIDTALSEFQQKILSPLYEDIRRTLDVTAGKGGSENHGSNFIGNLVVLIGVEVVAQFLSEGELEKFRHEQRGYGLNIGKEKRSEIERFYMLRHAPRGQSGSDLAKRFLQQYVGVCKPAYRDRKTVEHLWSFRNPHAHQFYPFIGKEVRGRVEWLYRDRDGRIGIGISDLEEELADPDRAKVLNVDRHLAVIDGWFISIPQILFVDFKVGVQAYAAAVREKEGVGRTFVQNYQRLRTFYEFEDL